MQHQFGQKVEPDSTSVGGPHVDDASTWWRHWKKEAATFCHAVLTATWIWPYGTNKSFQSKSVFLWLFTAWIYNMKFVFSARMCSSEFISFHVCGTDEDGHYEKNYLFFYFKGKSCSRELPSSTHLWTGAALHEYIIQIGEGVLGGACQQFWDHVSHRSLTHSRYLYLYREQVVNTKIRGQCHEE